MGKSAKINSKISEGHKNPFKSKFGNQKSNFKNKFANKKNFKQPKPDLAKEWGKEKFVPKFSNRSRDNETTGEAATPWGHFKTELLEKEREEAHSKAVNMNSTEAQEILKQREQNYRRTLIESQSKQPTKWEKFNEEEDEAESKAKNHDDHKSKQKKFKTQQKNKQIDGKERNFAGIELKNFDAKKLSFQQNNNMRKAITKGFMSVADKSLASAVRDLKRKEEKKQEKFKTEKEKESDTNRKRKHKK